LESKNMLVERQVSIFPKQNLGAAARRRTGVYR
jgi:hypothetical protein